MPHTSSLVTTSALNTKISEVENKVPDTKNLVTKNVENKICNQDKYITTPEFNKLTAESFAARLKQADLVNKTDFDNKLTTFNRRITWKKTKHLKVEKKLNSPITRDYNFFLGRIYFTSNDRSQNTCVSQPTFDALETKKDKCTDYILSWKSNGVFNSKLKPLYTFVQCIKISEYRFRIRFDKHLLALEPNNYLTKIVNACIVNDLDSSPRNPTNNLKFKNCLFGSTNVVKKMLIKKSIYLAGMEKHLAVQFHGLLITTLVEMLLVLVLIIVHHLLLTIAWITF